MLQFIVTNILFISIGTILYVIVRALPRIDEESRPPLKRTVLERWITSEIPDKLDEVASSIMEKTFRKLKVFLLRLDNAISRRLQKMKPDANGNGKKFDFSGLGTSSDKNGSEAKGEGKNSS